MGVPVLTVAGSAHVSRVGASILTAAGYPDLVCRDGPDLVRRAAALAGDGAALAELRASMRDRVGRSPLTDEAAHGRRFEAALRSMWRAWCGGEAGSRKDDPKINFDRATLDRGLMIATDADKRFFFKAQILREAKDSRDLGQEAEIIRRREVYNLAVVCALSEANFATFVHSHAWSVIQHKRR